MMSCCHNGQEFYLEILVWGRSVDAYMHIAHFWQFPCDIPLHLSMRQLIIEKGFGGEAEHFGGEASPPT